MTREDYKTLMLADDKSHGVIGTLLNYNGGASLTLCPECFVDDFGHLETCSIYAEVEGELK